MSVCKLLNVSLSVDKIDLFCLTSSWSRRLTTMLERVNLYPVSRGVCEASGLDQKGHTGMGVWADTAY